MGKENSKQQTTTDDYYNQPSGLVPEILGNLGMMSVVGSISGPRASMFNAHIAQAIVHTGTNRKRLRSGLEDIFGDYTYYVGVPEDCTIIKIIHKPGHNILNKNKLYTGVLIIYEEDKSKRIGCIETSYHCANHQHFGFAYKNSPILQNIHTNMNLEKGTILQDSPNKVDGSYNIGINAAVVNMGHPTVSEDGIGVSESFAKRITTFTYIDRVVSWNRPDMPLNCYGSSQGDYQIFPNIGEMVRNDNIIMGIRKADKATIMCSTNIGAMRQIDHFYDKLCYAPDVNSRVVGVKVITNGAFGIPNDNPMYSQLLYYINAETEYYQEIVDFYNSLGKRGTRKVITTPEFHNLLTHAIAMITRSQRKTSYVYKNIPLDDFMVVLTIETPMPFNLGFKATDFYGAKGVSCAIIPDEEMPVDQWGHRADVLMSPDATPNRENPGRVIELYMNATNRDFTERLRERMGLPRLPEHLDKALVSEAFRKVSETTIKGCLNDLVDFLHIAYPVMYKTLLEAEDKEEVILDYFEDVLTHGMYPINPPDSGVYWSDLIINHIESDDRFRPNYGPVTYTNSIGKKVTTKTPIRIGDVYLIVIEKIADDGFANSIAKTQSMGLLSPGIKSEYQENPYKQRPSRVIGEADTNLMSSAMGPMQFADLADRNTSTLSIKAIAKGIMESRTPTNIHCLVDRNKVPYGNNAPLAISSTMAICGGYEFVYIDKSFKPSKE